MSDPVITNNDLGSVILESGEFDDDELTLAGADTILAGTILARDSVSELLVLYVKGGSTNENGIPKVIITEELVAAGSGDFPVRVGVSGEYRLQRLVIDADQDASNIDKPVQDQLRDFGLVPVSVTQLAELDNQ